MITISLGDIQFRPICHYEFYRLLLTLFHLNFFFNFWKWITWLIMKYTKRSKTESQLAAYPKYPKNCLKNQPLGNKRNQFPGSSQTLRDRLSFKVLQGSLISHVITTFRPESAWISVFSFGSGCLLVLLEYKISECLYPKT